jgi:hypothetical protein
MLSDVPVEFLKEHSAFIRKDFRVFPREYAPEMLSKSCNPGDITLLNGK